MLYSRLSTCAVSIGTAALIILPVIVPFSKSICFISVIKPFKKSVNAKGKTNVIAK